MVAKTVTEIKNRYLFPSMKTYYDEPLVLTEGKGCRVRDSDGKWHLDLFGGILTVSIGHAHPKVVEAVTSQVKRLSHTSTCYLNQPLLDVAEKLATMAPGRLQKSFFTNSGTEAVETAIMAARAYTGRQEVIALRHSYHGRTALAMTLTGNAAWRATTVPGVVHTHNAYCYRCPFNQTYPGCGLACAHNLEEVIKTTTTGQVAAFIGEPIQGVGGFITPPPEFFAIIAGIVRRYGGVYISDEVQTGFGRTGQKMFGIEHWNVEPDMMVFAKGLANGTPVGATLATPEVADSIGTSTISTFGGNPVTMAAAKATLDFIDAENLPEHVAEMGRMFFDRLGQLQEGYRFLGDVRGKGLMIGLELVGDQKTPSPELAARFMRLALNENLLVGRGGLYHNVIRLTPPMTIAPDEVAEGLDKIARVCDVLSRS
jgi:4-aminobutyrate aminotransferase-like enzyme